ncbi:hypothetical protein EDF39_1415 [Frondihabitans sp. PhB161]|nr:hypothetical protein EDF37_1413 [Frondihabitans sp. PhB153]RPF09013.1 hypothetical protein EDF39_1415 [Frondihabitans sp. PhB161]
MRPGGPCIPLLCTGTGGAGGAHAGAGAGACAGASRARRACGGLAALANQAMGRGAAADPRVRGVEGAAFLFCARVRAARVGRMRVRMQGRGGVGAGASRARRACGGLAALANQAMGLGAAADRRVRGVEGPAFLFCARVRAARVGRMRVRVRVRRGGGLAALANQEMGRVTAADRRVRGEEGPAFLSCERRRAPPPTTPPLTTPPLTRRGAPPSSRSRHPAARTR